MAKKISLDRLAGEIANAITEYTEDVSEAIADKVDETAKEMCEDIKADAKRLFPKGTGAYAKGFKVTDRSSQGRVTKVVWNKAEYRLVHLLEHGHAKATGGRVDGRPHMGPASEKYTKQLVEDVKDIIKNGGAK